MAYYTDAEDGMSGVEIDFSVEEGEDSMQADEAIDTEDGDFRTQANTATGEPLRRQGQYHDDPDK